MLCFQHPLPATYLVILKHSSLAKEREEGKKKWIHARVPDLPPRGVAAVEE